MIVDQPTRAVQGPPRASAPHPPLPELKGGEILCTLRTIVRSNLDDLVNT